MHHEHMTSPHLYMSYRGAVGALLDAIELNASDTTGASRRVRWGVANSAQLALDEPR